MNQTNSSNFNSSKSISSSSIQFKSHSTILEISLPKSHSRPHSIKLSSSTNNRTSLSTLHHHSKHNSFIPTNASQSHQTTIPSSSSVTSFHLSSSSLKPQRIYETHQGNLMFCWNGKLVTSKPTNSIQLNFIQSIYNQIFKSKIQIDDPISKKWIINLPLQTICSFILIIGLGLIFYIGNFNHLNHFKFGQFILIFFGYSWLVCLSSMIKTILTDPGVIPRFLDPTPELEWKPTNHHKVSNSITISNSNSNLTNCEKSKLVSQPKPHTTVDLGEWELLPRWIKIEAKKPFNLTSEEIQMNSNHTRIEEIEVETEEEWIESKWCSTCLTYRPPRSSHCRMCDCCIDGLDHHCTYLNNCIGSRNYLYYITFLLTSVLNLIIIFSTSISRLIHFHQNNQFDSHPISVAILVISSIVLFPITTLLSYHVFLTFKGLTTVEHIKIQARQTILNQTKSNNNFNRLNESRKNLKKSNVLINFKNGFYLIFTRLCAPLNSNSIPWHYPIDQI